MILILTTFILTTGLYGSLFWLAARQVARHIQENPEAMNALSTHLFLPIFGKKREAAIPEPVLATPAAEASILTQAPAPSRPGQPQK
jgi:hypothetical protein